MCPLAIKPCASSLGPAMVCGASGEGAAVRERGVDRASHFVHLTVVADRSEVLEHARVRIHLFVAAGAGLRREPRVRFGDLTVAFGNHGERRRRAEIDRRWQRIGADDVVVDGLAALDDRVGGGVRLRPEIAWVAE